MTQEEKQIWNENIPQPGLVTMFCSDPCEDLAKKDVLSSLIRTSIDNPSNGKIIFKSFVKELSFWEMNEVGNQTATDDEYGVSNMVKRNKRL